MVRNRTSQKKHVLMAAAALLGIGAMVVLVAWGRGLSPGGPDPAEARALATQLIAQDQAAQALEALEDLRLATRGERLDDQSELVRLHALEAAGRQAELADAAGAFLSDRNPGEARDEIEIMRLTALVATAGISNPSVVTAVGEFVERHPRHPRAAELHLAMARHRDALGDRAAARRAFEAAEAAAQDHEARNRARRALGQMNLEALYRGDPEIVRITDYTVKPGDSIWEIARAHGTTQELVMRINNITNPRALRVGQQLRVPSPEFALVCDVPSNTLTLYNGGRFLAQWPVRTGRVPGTTPEGEFRILNKKTGPTWRPGNGFVYEPGDPNNELGTRWMAFEGDLLGIHGTLHPETVGHYASNGCIGMRTPDVEELFDLVTVGTPLRIQGAQDPSRARVIPAREVPPPQGRSVANR